MNNLKLIKLSNGEDIVCNVTKESQNFVDVHLPLKMSLINRETEYGMVESLTMRHWIEPLSEKSDYSINKKTIVTMTEASAGLGVFYEKMIVELDDLSLSEPKFADDVYAGEEAEYEEDEFDYQQLDTSKYLH